VVDDNPANLMEISMLMRARGVVPFLAADGAEAVALACELPFDLILMDLQMPILDGLGASAAIRRFEATTSPGVRQAHQVPLSCGIPGDAGQHGML
jgi:CheY-like chemotaxis protein